MMKGIQDERSLVQLLWKRGFAVIRSPASGASTKMPRPDLIAGNHEKRLQFAIEVKTTAKKVLYVRRESINQLLEFSQRFGCQPIVALKFKGWRNSWIFILPHQMMSTPHLNFKISREEALRKGMDIKTLIGEGKQTKLISEGKNHCKR
jgi:Holliday junction resolvase